MRALIVLAALLAMQGCGRHVGVDPRDEAAVAGGCDRSSATVTLKAINQGTFSVKVHLVTRSGFHQSLHPTVHGFQTEEISVGRRLMDSGGHLILEITGGGLVMSPPRPIPLNPMSCSVGTLWIAPSPSMSSYAGAEF